MSYLCLQNLEQANKKELATILDSFKMPGQQFIMEWKVNRYTCIFCFLLFFSRFIVLK